MEESPDSPWRVTFSNQARKQKEKLPDDMRKLLAVLTAELEWPEQLEWRNYGKLGGKGKNQDFQTT
jgi:mRNA-degrading endonuclease RelE of RelBE toxin-antitoxin system